jgi:putative membrane protein
VPLKDFVEPIRSSKTLGHVFWLAVLASVYSMLAVGWELSHFGDTSTVSSKVHGVLSVVLGLLLVFRTNTAYNRWWEARTLWGTLVNTMRNLSVKFCTLGSFTGEEKQAARELLIHFPVSLRCHLRNEIGSKCPADTRALDATAQHLPLAIAQQLYRIVGDAKRAGRLEPCELRVFDADLARIMDVCGGCERILKTRIVKSYRVFARQCVLIFVATLPWGVAHEFTVATIPITFLATYFMLGLETVAEHVEEPFGYDEDDLDLESLCETIAASVSEVFAR